MTDTNKPTIVHVIDDLGRGGAETLLVDLLKDLTRYYNIVLVTLTDHSEFDEKEINYSHRYCLNYKSKLSFPGVIKRLRKIIREHKPVLVRSQLYWSTIVARLACPRDIPLVFSVHITLSDGIFKFTRKSILLKWLEKRTYKKRHTMIGVTQEVIDDYKRTIGMKGRHYLLHNYVNDKFFAHQADYHFTPGSSLKMVAVGNPKIQKNYEVILEAFRELDGTGVSCDIFGSSSYNAQLQEAIDRYKLPVYLKGKSATVYNELKKYDAYIMSSHFEGFGIAVAEAMAVGLPVFLSDINVLREVSMGNAIYFNPANSHELAEKIRQFREGKYNAAALSQKGKEITEAYYSKKVYLARLLSIYTECIAG